MANTLFYIKFNDNISHKYWNFVPIYRTLEENKNQEKKIWIILMIKIEELIENNVYWVVSEERHIGWALGSENHRIIQWKRVTFKLMNLCFQWSII